MELEEFRELALQSLPKLSRGRTIRYTLVRTPGEFFLNKIHRQQYLDLRSIPLMKNYRFIQSSLTHSEYSAFKDDFYDDLDFLRVRTESFSNLIPIASRLGFGLYGFSASGNGRIDVKSPGKGLTSEDLQNLLLENQEKGMKPFLITFSKDGHRVTVRKDFNYFVHGGYWDAMGLIYSTSVAVIEKDFDLLEKMSKLRLTHKSKPEKFVGLESISYPLDDGYSRELVIDRMKKNFLVGEIRNTSELTSIYAFHRTNERSRYRIDVSDSSLEFLPMPGSRMEGVMELIESLEGDGSS